MASTPESQLPGGATSGDVVAVLADVAYSDATRIARVAVREAVARAARLRFLLLVPPGLSVDDRAHADEATFSAALRALREAPRLPVTFEAVEGDAREVYVRRGRGAVAVVLEEGTAGTEALVRHCESQPTCEVITVPRSAPGAVTAPLRSARETRPGRGDRRRDAPAGGLLGA